MATHIKTTGISLTPAISEYVTKRVDKVLALMNGDPTLKCDIELGKTTSHHHKGDIFKAEIHIIAAGKNLYAANEAADLYAAIDAVRDEILGEIRSDKGKRISLVRRSGARVKDMVKGLWPWK